MADRSPLREAAVQALDEASGAVIVGDPGVGKTTLVREMTTGLERAATEQTVVWLRTPAKLIATPWGILEPLIGAEHGPEPGVDEVGRLIERCRRALRDLPGRPLLVIDDLHLVDAVTAVVVAEIAQTQAAQILATCRRQPGPPAAVGTLLRQNLLHQVDVAGLTYDEVEAVLTTALQGPVALETIWKTWEVTGGNPLYLRELVRSLRDAGAMVEVDGAWVWNDRGVVGRRLTDLIQAELATLSPAERDVADLLALAGPTAIELLAGAIEDAALTAMTDRGLVVLEADQHDGVLRARLVHPVHVDVIRATVPPRRRRILYERLQNESADVTHPAALFSTVDWALSCGVTPPVEDLIAAARAAAKLADARLVRRLTEAALAHLEPADPRALDLRMTRAQSDRFAGNFRAAREDLDVVAAHLPAGVEGEQLRWRHARLVANLQQYGADDVDAALTTIEHVELTTPPLWQARQVDRLVRLAWAGDYRRGLGELERFAERKDHPQALRASMLGSLIAGLGQAGRLEESLRLADDALRSWQTDSERYPWLLWEVLGTRFLAALWIGDPEGAMNPPHIDDPMAKVDDAVVQVGHGRYHAARGEWSLATAQFRGALSRFAVRDPSGFGPTASANLSYSLAALGDREGATRARRDYETAQSGASRVVYGDSQMRVAAASVALGEDDAAQRCADLDAWSSHQGLWLWAMHARHLRCVVEAASNRPTRMQVDHLTHAARRVEGPLGPLVVAHAQALAEGDAVLAGRLAGRLAERGVWIPECRVTHLTSRQREIALLVRAGLSNREIAERLTLSVRTVDTHVGNIFERLGVGTRSDLASVLGGFRARPRHRLTVSGSVGLVEPVAVGLRSTY
ncbi:hypothetical protein BHE97_11455 [Aeromicrobium sp. PE09-221]|nr:hypothetical protein BHE97_11455 [Aeromicrobium sp. PE09-221]